MSEVTLGRRRALPPLTFTLPSESLTSTSHPRARVARVCGVAMYAAALALVVVNERFRGLEAAVIRPLAGLVTGGHGSVAAGSIVYFALGTPRAFGLQVTDECTSALLLIPLLVMMGSFATFSHIGLRRQLAALLVGAVLIVGVNVLRVSGIAWATWRFGYDPGYTLSHVFVGSAFSLVGFVGAMLAALWVLVRSEREPRRRPGTATPLVTSTAAPLVTSTPTPTSVRPRPRPGPGIRPTAGQPRPGNAMYFDIGPDAD